MTIARIGRYAISVCAAAILTACGGSLTTPNAVVPAQSGATSSAHNDAGGCPIKRCIIVTSQSGYKSKPLAAVLFFARNANGNVRPAGEISGSNTMMNEPYGLAMDSQNNLYVSNYNDTITVYAAGSQGNVAPIRAIAGNKTKLNNPGGLAIDSQGELYVGNSPNNTGGWINVYAPGANGNVAPIRQIRGKNTELYAPLSMTFDSQAELYVLNEDPNTGWITVFAPGAKGDATPERTIKGSATKLAGPTGMEVDASGYIYIVNGYEAVLIFAPNANGNVAPISNFSAAIYAFGVGLDARENIYITGVTYDDPAYIAVVAAGTVGNKGQVLRKIEGRKTSLISPKSIIVK